MKRLFPLGFGLLALGASWVAIGACSVGDIDLENRSCPCGVGYACDTSRNVCVRPEMLFDAAAFFDAAVPCRGPDCACADDASCSDPAFPKCVGAKCVACNTSPDSCAVGSYCLPTHECAPGCKADTECAALSPSSPVCNTQRHQCVECAVDGNCQPGMRCSPAGKCTTSCTNEGQPCAGGGTTCCGGLCIDTQSDPNNCNGCGTACAGATTLCCAGACTDPLTNVAHCGKCAAPCNSTLHTAPGTTCLAGACKFTCSSGWGHCATGNTGCETSLVNNIAACGSCTNNCNVAVLNATGKTCAGTQCDYSACVAPYTDLDGRRYNGCEPCGLKGQFCCNNTTCLEGTCEPLPADDGKCH